MKSFSLSSFASNAWRNGSNPSTSAEAVQTPGRTFSILNLPFESVTALRVVDKLVHFEIDNSAGNINTDTRLELQISHPRNQPGAQGAYPLDYAMGGTSLR